MRIPPPVVTLTLNPAIDQSARVKDFQPGAVNRVQSVQIDAGGKGVNVASFLAHFDHRVTATGLMGQDNALIFERLFAEKHIEDHFIRIPGRVRVNVKLVDATSDQVTDINYPGAAAPASGYNAIKEMIVSLSDEGMEHFVLAGSMPQDGPDHLFHDLIDLLKAKGASVYLDTSGEALRLGLKATPDVIKPNLAELRAVTGKPLTSHSEIIDEVHKLSDGGIGLSVVSMGTKGALFITETRCVLAKPPATRVVSSVGAGDAMVAGIIHGRLCGLPLHTIARQSTAFAIAALGEIGPNLPYKETVLSMADQIEVEDLVV